MTMRKKIILWGLGSFLMVLLAFVLIAPTLIDSMSLKEKIQTAAAQKKIGKIDYHKAYLSVLPLPHLTIEKMSFSSPQGIVASVDNLEIYPELLPLFRGQLRLFEVVMGSPEFKVVLSDEHAKKGVSGKDSSSFDLSDNLVNAIFPLRDYTSGLTVSIDQGRFELKEEGQQKLEIRDFDLDADLDFTGISGFDVEVNIVDPFLSINRSGEMLEIDGDRLKAELSVNKEEVVFSLTDLRLAQPALKLSGRFIASPKTTGFSLDLNGKDLDVKAIRVATLGLGGDNETVNDIFSYLKSGRIPAIHVQSKSKSLSALGDLDNMIIQGRLLNADISIDDIGMQLAEVEGDALISNGLFEASGASARLGETTGHDGSLKIGLATGNDTFHLDIMLNAQLAQVPPVLKKIIDDETILHELSLFANIEGVSKGRLILGESIDEINTKIEISEMNFSADYQRVPFPIEISRGKLIYKENMVDLEDLDARIGNSTFSETSCNVQWENGFDIDIPNGRLRLDLVEFYPWVSSFEALQESLADVKEVKGDLELSTFKLSKHHDINDQWQLSATGEVKAVSINTTQLPEMLHLSSGKFQVSPNQLLCKNLNAQLMDAEFDLTGTLLGDIRQPESLNVSLNGDVGEKFIYFLNQSGHLPTAYVVHAPVKLANTNFIWQSSDDFSFTGNIFFPKGLQLFSDFQYQTGGLKINRLDIQDQESKATLAFEMQKNMISIGFNGYLHNKTLDRIFVVEKVSDGWLKGNLQAAFVKDNLSESTLKGQLEGGNIIIPLAESAPLIIDKLLFVDKNNKIDVKQLSLSHGENHVDLKGQVDMTSDMFMLNLDASVGDFKWDAFEKAAKEPTQGSSDKPGIDFWMYPVSGVINLAVKSFSLGEYTWKPVYAQICRDHARIKIDVTEANLYGIDTLGTFIVDENILDLDFKCTAKDRDIASTLGGLNKKQIEMTGLYEFNGQVKARGQADQLFHTAQGQFNFKASNGIITKDKKLSRILEVINFTEIVKGRIPDLKTEGFSYETITVQGELTDNMIDFTKLYMDGNTLDLHGKGTLDLEQQVIDIKLLAAPFKTVDSAIKSIPGVNYLMAGNLVSIPVSVKGSVTDPKVSIMYASEISSGFLDFAERAIKSPIKLIKSMNFYKKPKPE
jgi:hypothetical protein